MSFPRIGKGEVLPRFSLDELAAFAHETKEQRLTRKQAYSKDGKNKKEWSRIAAGFTRKDDLASPPPADRPANGPGR